MDNNNKSHFNSNINQESNNYNNCYTDEIINNNLTLDNTETVNSMGQKPNVFDFDILMNKILSLLKNYFHNDNLYLNNIKLISESINEQTLFSRCSINDILLYLNQITYPRYNSAMANMNEKYIKEKLNILNDRLGKIDELKDNMNQNIRNTEIELITYYEESRNILQKIKILYKYGKYNKQYETEFYNNELINIMKKNYNKLLKENNELKMNLRINNQTKRNNSVKNKNKKNNLQISFGNTRNNSCSRMNSQNYYINTNSSIGTIKDEAKKIKNVGKNNILNNNKYNNKKQRNKSNNISKVNPLALSKDSDTNKNYYINIIIDLASMFLSFLKDMKNLQEIISKKNNNIKEYKKNFELNKKSLKIFCEKVINNRNSPEKIKTLKINNINDIKRRTSKPKENNYFNKNSQLEVKISSLEKTLNEKNIKINKLETEISSQIYKNAQLMSRLNEYIEKENKNKNFENNLVEFNNLKENIKKLSLEINNKNSKIKSLETTASFNKQLEEENKNQKKSLEDLNNKIKNEIIKNNNLNNQLSKLKTLENELLTIKNENIQLKQKIRKNNDDISSKNESIIKEKDKIINNLNNNIKELNDKININNSNKENNNKIYLEINNLLKQINIESQKNINELLDKDKNFNLYMEKNNQLELKKNNENESKKLNDEINNKLYNLKDIQNEYEKLIVELKQYNNIFKQENNGDKK